MHSMQKLLVLTLVTTRSVVHILIYQIFTPFGKWSIDQLNNQQAMPVKCTIETIASWFTCIITGKWKHMPIPSWTRLDAERWSLYKGSIHEVQDNWQ